MEVRLDKIEFDEDIYPRRKINHETIKNYLEALKGGAIFPPVEVQKIKHSDGEEKFILLDGKHRLLAMEEFNKWLQENGQDGLKPVKPLK